MAALPDGFHRMLWMMVWYRPVIRTPSAKNNKKWKPAAARAAAPRGMQRCEGQGQTIWSIKALLRSPQEIQINSQNGSSSLFPLRFILVPWASLPPPTPSPLIFFLRPLSGVAGSVPAAAVSSKLLRNASECSQEGFWGTDPRDRGFYLA